MRAIKSLSITADKTSQCLAEIRQKYVRMLDLSEQSTRQVEAGRVLDQKKGAMHREGNFH